MKAARCCNSLGLTLQPDGLLHSSPTSLRVMSLLRSRHHDAPGAVRALICMSAPLRQLVWKLPSSHVASLRIALGLLLCWIASVYTACCFESILCVPALLSIVAITCGTRRTERDVAGRPFRIVLEVPHAISIIGRNVLASGTWRGSRPDVLDASFYRRHDRVGSWQHTRTQAGGAHGWSVCRGRQCRSEMADAWRQLFGDVSRKPGIAMTAGRSPTKGCE